MKRLLLAALILCSWGISQAQQYRWAQGAASSNIQYRRCATDKYANCYVTGYFSGTAVFGSTTFTASGYYDMFLAKYDSSGALIWVVKGGGTNQDYAYNCAVDSACNVYVVGSFTQSATFGSQTVTSGSATSPDAFVAKFNKNGSCIWVNRMGGTAGEAAYAIDCNNKGDIWVSGYFQGYCGFASQSANTQYLTANGGYDVFLVKYNKIGNVNWVRLAGGNGWNWGYDMTVDEYGNSYLVGYYQSSITFYSFGNKNNLTLQSHSSSFYSGFVAKYDNSGMPKWAVNAPKSNYYGYANAIAGDGYGNIYITGFFSGQAIFGKDTLGSSTSGWAGFICKMNTNGQFEWAHRMGENNFWCYSMDLAANASGNVFVTGYTWNSSFSGGTLCGNNLYDAKAYYKMFAVKYNDSGECRWTVHGTSGAGNNHWSYGMGIGANDFGGINISGYYGGWGGNPVMKFKLSSDTMTYGNLVSNNTYGGFLSLFWDENFIIEGDPPQTHYCPGDTVKIPYKAYGLYDSSNVFTATLSDSLGSFLQYISVGAKAGREGVDTVVAVIPDTMPNGFGYRFRIQSNLPRVRSNKNFYDIEIWRPSAYAGLDTVMCVNDNIQLSGSGDSALAFLWKSNFAIKDSTFPNPFVSPKSSTAIILKTTSKYGCVNFDTMQMQVVAEPKPDAGLTDSVCVGDSIQLQALGGGTYRWLPATGLTDDSIANPKAFITQTTTYTVMVGNGICERPDSVKIVLRNPLKVFISGSKTLCIGQSVLLKANPTGGKPSQYQFTWLNAVGQMVSDSNALLVNPTKTSTYRVVLSDNCTLLNDTATVTIVVRPPLKMTIRQDSTICKGQAINLWAKTSGGDSLNYSYTLFSNGIPIATASKANWSMKPDSTTTYSIKVTDNCTSISDSGQVTITVRPPLQVQTKWDSISVCIGDKVTITPKASGGYAPTYTFDYYADGLFYSSKQGSETFAISKKTLLMYIVKDNCTQRNDTGYFICNITQNPSIVVRPDTVICVGQPVTLWATSSQGLGNRLTFIWNGIGNGDKYSVSPATTTLYKVAMLDKCSGKIDSGSVLINVRLPLEAAGRPDTIVCNGQFVKLFASGSGGDSLQHTFTWYDDLQNTIGSGTAMVSPTITTTYKVVLSDNCTVQPDTDEVTVKVRLPLQIAFTKDTTICLGQSVDLAVDASGGDSLAYSIVWSDGSGAGFGQKVMPTQTTSYKVVLKDNCTFKSDSATMTITVRPGLSVDLGPDTTLCTDQTIVLKATSSGGWPAGYGWVWYEKGTGVALSYSDTLQVNAQATKTYRVTFWDGCTVGKVYDEITVTVRPPLWLNLSQGNKICEGDSIYLEAEVHGGDSNNWKFNWTPAITNLPMIWAKPTVSTLYTLVLDDGCSQAVSDTANVEVESLPVLSFEVDTTIGCEPFEVQFNNTSSYLPGSAIRWWFGDGRTDSVASPTHTYTHSATFDLGLSIVSPFGCKNSLLYTDYFTVYPSPRAAFEINPRVTDIEHPLVNFTNLTLGGNYYAWELANTLRYDTNFSYRFTDTGWYKIYLTTSNTFGCNDWAIDSVHIKEVFKCWIPEAFTPNGNNLNEVFKPTTLACTRFTAKIYNRWGERVFETEDSGGWNGRFNNEGTQAESGFYFYRISAWDQDGKVHDYKGMVFLIR